MKEPRFDQLPAAPGAAPRVAVATAEASPGVVVWHVRPPRGAAWWFAVPREARVSVQGPVGGVSAAEEVVCELASDQVGEAPLHIAHPEGVFGPEGVPLVQHYRASRRQSRCW